MVQYKTVAVPLPILKGIKSKDIFTVGTANKIGTPYAQLLQNEAKGGWTLHSIQSAEGRVIRKKGILEILLGWIPIVNFLVIPRNSDDYYDVSCIFATFFREA